MKILVRLIMFTCFLLFLVWAARNGHLPQVVETVAGVLAGIILACLLIFLVLFKMPLLLSLLAFLSLVIVISFLLESYQFSVTEIPKSLERAKPQLNAVPKLFKDDKQ